MAAREEGAEFSRFPGLVYSAPVRLLPVLLLLLGCATAPPLRPPGAEFGSAAADAAWAAELAEVEARLRAGALGEAELVVWSDRIRARRDAAFRGIAPPLSAAMVRRTAALVRDLEAARSGGRGGPLEPFRLVFRWPIERAAVTSEFGERRDPIDRDVLAFHNGIDLAAPHGAAVNAAAPGRIAAVEHRGDGCGLTITVEHPYGYRTEYCHLSDAVVEADEQVRGGQVIGMVGRTGRTTGSHLHWIVRQDGAPIDPRGVVGLAMPRSSNGH